MTQQTNDRAQQALQLYKAKDYEAASPIYRELWDEKGDAFSGSRYVHCLRKSGQAKQAVDVARQVIEKYPTDIYVRREMVWAMYDAEVKPAKEQNDLGRLLSAGQQIVELTGEALPVQLVSFAVISAAKDRGKWEIVSEWCDRLNQHQLSREQREMGGRRVISECEQWYFAKVKSLLELQRWDEARQLGLEASEAFPRNRHFARWAAQALAGQGQLPEAIAELEALAAQGRPEWYLLNDLAELKMRNGDAEEALTISCQAALSPGEDKAKVGLYLVIGQAAMGLKQLDVALRHAVLSRLVRTREGWSIPGDVMRLETDIRSEAEQSGESLPEQQDDLRAVAVQCRQDWERVVPPEMRSRPQSKRRGRPSAPPVDPAQPVRRGRIKIYFEDRGFGFIVADDGNGDVFFHIKNVADVERPEQGMVVEYQVVETPKGLNAVNVQLV